MLAPTGLGFVAPTAAAPHTLSGFRGAADTLGLMRQQTWGIEGEKSGLVRAMSEGLVRELLGKAYMSEILAIRNFTATYLRYTNDPLHVEYVKTPQRMVEEIAQHGVAAADCDEIAELVGTMALQVGRQAEFVVVGFGAPGDYSHVFARVKEPKTGEWIVCDAVAGTDERTMLDRVSTYEVWSLDELAPPAGTSGFWSRGMGYVEPPVRTFAPRPYPWRQQ